MQLSDRVGVMRRGKLIGVVNTADTDERRLAAMMVGRDVIFDDIRQGEAGKTVVLAVDGLCAQSDRGLPAVRGVSLTVYAGEIVGVCGVEGNGQTELTECIMGLRPQTAGTVTLSGQDVSRLSPGGMRQMGVSWIPDDRLHTGLSAKATVTENLLVGKQRRPEFSLFGIHYRAKNARRYAEGLAQAFDIRAGGLNVPAGSLSGGNMQKAILAREFSFASPVLVVSQPTRGVDIGAIEFIHEKILEKRNAGCAILLVSADLDELFRLSDRLLTLYEGRVTGEFAAGEIDKQRIGYYMTGGRQKGAGEA
jgi:simple sugar transport system ATP-binding protein